MTDHKSTLYLQVILNGLKQHPFGSAFKINLPKWKEDTSYMVTLEKATKYATGSVEHTKTQSFLRPVATTLALANKPAQPISNRFFSQRKLSLGEEQFPDNNPQSTDIAFWADFQKDLNSLPQGNDWAKAETLLHIIHKYCGVLPSGYQEDVSFYDLIKSQAGMAICLYQFENEPLLENEQRNPQAPFLLVGGGLSGIQHYLFDVASRNAAKNMKGRSYFLHLLSDSVVQVVLDELDLFQANVVIATGGGFQIIVPNTLEVRTRLEVLRADIRMKLFEDYQTQLFLEFAWTELTEEHLLNGKMGEAWGGLYTQFSEQKRQKFKGEILSGYKRFFEPTEVGGEEVRDAISVEELPKGSDKWKLEGAYPVKLSALEVEAAALEREKIIGRISAEQIWLGLRLRKSNVHVTSLSDVEMSFLYRKLEENEHYDKIAQLDAYQVIVLKEEFNQVLFKGKKASIRFINDLDGFLEHAPNRSESFGFQFYGGNEIPKIEAKSVDKPEKAIEWLPKTFSELALQADDDRIYSSEVESQFKQERFKRLAILRMDVDGLGTIFQEGFKVDGSLTRYAALSRQMDWFFKGHLNEIWRTGITEDGQPYGEFTQILYSGGDDLFIVGKWDCVLDMAAKIRDAFKDYTCHSPYFNISGGMVMVTPKFPVARAAKWCEEEEKKAKDHTLNSSANAKDSFSLFGFPLKWDTEFKLVKILKDKLLDFLKKHSNHKGLLIALQEFDETRKEQIKSGYAESWRWQLAYQLNRAIKRNNLESEKIIRELQLGIFFDDCSYTKEVNLKRGESCYPFLQLLSLAARWAEFELRSGGVSAIGDNHHD